MSRHTSTSSRSHVLPKAPIISLDLPGRLLTCHVLALSGWSHSTLYQRISEGFPAPRKDGRLNYWTTDVIRTALGLDQERGA
jgi:hypothetical protein